MYTCTHTHIRTCAPQSRPCQLCFIHFSERVLCASMCVCAEGLSSIGFSCFVFQRLFWRLCFTDLQELSENELIHYGVSKVGWRKKLMSRARDEHRRRHITTAKMPDCCICLERPVSVAMVQKKCTSSTCMCRYILLPSFLESAVLTCLRLCLRRFPADTYVHVRVVRNRIWIVLCAHNQRNLRSKYFYLEFEKD